MMINTDIRVAISGAGGRMGRDLIKAISQHDRVVLGAALGRRDSEIIGIDAGELVGISRLNVKITDNLVNVLDKFDILIDFSGPENSKYCLSICEKYFKSIIIGTTGFNEVEQLFIKKASKIIPIILAANFSIGINLLLKLLEKYIKVIAEYSDIKIIEVHHRNKVDAPSGTSLMIRDVISNSIVSYLKNCSSNIYINSNKQDDDINITTIRVNNIIGEHTIIFANNNEKIKITHKALNRNAFVNGVLKACLWLKWQKNGLYSMKDVLNI
ncbi:4-hydroxy-tetrahydrodipicolinate reductase [Candidatus Arsenophonus lipoptenae]